MAKHISAFCLNFMNKILIYTLYVKRVKYLLCTVVLLG